MEPTVDIRILGISKEFGTTGALRDVSLDIADGELVALLGPSGSGKTTLLRVIAGLETPSAGRVLFANEDATRLPVQGRRIGFVFQHYALFKHLTVFENIAYGLRVRARAERPTGGEIARRVRELLELVQLPDVEKRYPMQLSGGQRQRVALARALAVEPRVLLLDEPFGALDAKVRKDLRRWLREVHERTRHTTIFVTHDQEEALELADRVAILNEGRLEQIGTAEDVYDRPASPFVMAFVGDTSTLPIEMREGCVSVGGVAVAADIQGEANGRAHLYLRPGDVVLTDAQSSPLRGTVSGMRRTATGRRVQVQVGPADTVIEVEAPASARVKVGDCIGVTIRQGRVFAG
jgi:sulfate transport system ATP-binding protein